jgi:DNA topoisomerase IB
MQLLNDLSETTRAELQYQAILLRNELSELQCYSDERKGDNAANIAEIKESYKNITLYLKNYFTTWSGLSQGCKQGCRQPCKSAKAVLTNML